MVKTIYFVFEDECPTKDDLKKEGYDDLIDFLNYNVLENDIADSILGAYDTKTYTFFSDYFDNQNDVLSKIKEELNITDSVSPILFKEDTSFQNDDYMKITTNKEQLRTFLKFITNLHEEYLNIYKEQIHNDTGNLPQVNQLNDAMSPSHKDLTHIRNQYTDPFKQDCAFGVIDIETESIDFYDKNEFINEVIWNANKENKVTYYVNTKLCAEYW